MGNGVWNLLESVATTGQGLGKIGTYLILVGGLVTAIGCLNLMRKPSLKLRSGREIGRRSLLLLGGLGTLLGLAAALFALLECFK